MLAAALGELVARTGSSHIGPEVAAAVRLRILDTLGAGLAGIHLNNHRPLLPLLESAARESTLWGAERRASRREAALVNSFATHSTYLEDGSRFTGGHPSSVVIPAALAEAEAQRDNGPRLIAAVAAGYEVFLRLGRALYPATVTRGFQSTAVLGSVSAAAAIASLRRLDPATCGHALAIAANLGIGMKEALKSSASQPIQVARSCEGGFVAATLAEGGLAGAEAIFEKGFLPAFGCESGTESILTEGERIAETYLKRHAGCRGNHAPLDAALALRERHALDIAHVKRVTIFVDTVTRAAAIEPPANGEQAQFSIGFSVAVALLDGNASIFQYRDERVADDEVRALMSRISVEVDLVLDAGYPENRAARVEIEMDDGRVLQEAVANARGEPEWPLTRREIEEKFMTLATPGLGRKAATGLMDAVAGLESVPDVSEVTALLVRESAR